MEDEIKEILENVMYWDTCPEDYKQKIIKYLNKDKDLTKCHHNIECIEVGLGECVECGKKFSI